MKTKSLETLAREAERETAINAVPKISFTKATRARFRWQNEVHAVGTCPLSILHAFLAHYGGVALPGCPAKVDEALNCLEPGYGELGRWQAIDTLLVYKVALPLISNR